MVLDRASRTLESLENVASRIRLIVHLQLTVLDLHCDHVRQIDQWTVNDFWETTTTTTSTVTHKTTNHQLYRLPAHHRDLQHPLRLLEEKATKHLKRIVTNWCVQESMLMNYGFSDYRKSFSQTST